MRKTLLGTLPLLLVAAGCQPNLSRTRASLPYSLGPVLYADDFSGDLSHWLAEGGRPCIREGRMEIDTSVGCTAWFKPALAGNVLIEYDVTAISAGGPNDRVSDLNCFWMATDPAHPDDLFAAAAQRTGIFKNYDSLSLYYVGYGGNTNSTTRFRRYAGGRRQILGEYTDPAHLIIANHTYHIQLVTCDGAVEFYRDGRRLFRYADPAPLTSGHFGLRTTQNRLTMDNFCVRRIVGRPSVP
jgi:hypothetical protein